MKETFRKKIESMRDRIAARVQQLSENMESYIESNNYGAASTCDVKKRQLEMVLNELNEHLSNS